MSCGCKKKKEPTPVPAQKPVSSTPVQQSNTEKKNLINRLTSIKI